MNEQYGNIQGGEKKYREDHSVLYYSDQQSHKAFLLPKGKLLVIK